ncbi:glycoside hydrolase family 18 protein [Streptomyces daliensis]
MPELPVHPHRPGGAARRRRGFQGLVATACTAVLAATLLSATASANTNTAQDARPAAQTAQAADTKATAAGKVVGYFTNWGVYQRNYHVKNIETSGSANKLTHINYAFGNVQGGKCTVGDSYADYEKAYTADQSVDGKADTWDQPLRGNFNQLRKLKQKHPNLKVLWSFGGWTWSGGFAEAAKNPAAFADSCHSLLNDSRWAGLFDGIDIDWEYPNACGLTCDTSGAAAFGNVMKALRAKFGTNKLVTAAITADASSGGKLDATDYKTASQYVDWYLPMTYDYFGAWDAKGPTAPHSPLTSYSGIPKAGFNTADTTAKLKAKGVPASKLLLGLGFYGRGWTGVTQSAPGGTATGAAPGTYEAGIEDYKVLKTKCPTTGKVGGTAYAHCGNQWWSYDTPETIGTKSDWATQQGMGGSFFWELSGDTANGELIKAIR